MVNVRKLLKTYNGAGALHCLFAPRRFVDDRVFLTKGNQLGMALAIDGVDEECLTEATLEAYTRRWPQLGAPLTTGSGCINT